jgi:hypothetical protein
MAASISVEHPENVTRAEVNAHQGPAHVIRLALSMGGTSAAIDALTAWFPHLTQPTNAALYYEPMIKLSALRLTTLRDPFNLHSTGS